MPLYHPPVLDLAGFFDDSVSPKSIDEAASKFDKAMRDTGVIYLDNCGIPEELMATLRRKALNYFRDDSSDRIYSDKYGNEGYTAMGSEMVSSSQTYQASVRDTVESLYIFSADSDKCPEELRDVVRDYRQRTLRVMLFLVRLMAHALGEPKLNSLFDANGHALKLAHYPAGVEGTQGYGPHKDYGSYTLLAQDDGDAFPVQGALELFSDGVWYTVPPRKGALLVNAGMLIERWTNGLYKSALHRVTLSKDRTHSRLSIVYFTSPKDHTCVKPLEQCCSKDLPPKFKPVLSHEWVQHKLDLNNGNTASKIF